MRRGERREVLASSIYLGKDGKQWAPPPRTSREGERREGGRETEIERGREMERAGER